MEQQQRTRDQLLRALELYERDRQLLAYEIHDGCAQQLTGAMLCFQSCRQLRDANPREANDAFERGLRLLGDGLAEVRRLIGGLRPAVLDESGVVAAIGYLVNESRQQGGPEIAFRPDGQFHRLAHPLEHAVYRIVQESLTNARRHSKSPRVEVRLTQQERLIRIEVEDWGIGFDPRIVPRDRFGLQGISERARLLDGQTTIVSAPGQGTRVVVELPLMEPTGDEADKPAE